MITCSRTLRIVVKTVFCCTIFSLALLFVGCETPSEPETKEEKPKAEKEKPEVTESGENGDSLPAKTKNKDSVGECSNPYYPIETRIERQYKITGTAPATYVLKQVLGTGGRFTEERKFATGMEVVSNWSCTGEGLRNADYNSSVSTSGTGGTMKTLESSGITLPKVWQTGKRWTATYKIRTDVAGRSMDGTVSVENEIVSLDDNVSVQGGDFVAARVNSVIKVNMSVGSTKIPTPPINMSNWYARNFGLVKQEVKSQFGTSTVEYAGEK